MQATTQNHTEPRNTGALSPVQEAELLRMKQMCPYRIAYAALHPETGDFYAAAVFDMRKPNAAARAGYTVFILKAS